MHAGVNSSKRDVANVWAQCSTVRRCSTITLSPFVMKREISTPASVLFIHAQEGIKMKHCACKLSSKHAPGCGSSATSSAVRDGAPSIIGMAGIFGTKTDRGPQALGRGDNARGDHGLPFASFSMDCIPASGAYRRVAGVSHELALPVGWLTSVVDAYDLLSTPAVLRASAASNVQPQPCTSRASTELNDHEIGVFMVHCTVRVTSRGPVYADIYCGTLHKQQNG